MHRNTAAPINLMKAIRSSANTACPDVVKLDELEKPVPNDDQIFISKCGRLHSTRLMHHLIRDSWIGRLMFGLRKPREKRGSAAMWPAWVEVVGKNITQFKPGDEVFGFWGPGLTWPSMPLLPERALWPAKPADVRLSKPPVSPMAGLSSYGTARFARGGKDHARAEGFDQRRYRRSWDVCRAHAKSLGAEVTGCLQHKEC